MAHCSQMNGPGFGYRFFLFCVFFGENLYYFLVFNFVNGDFLRLFSNFVFKYTRAPIVQRTRVLGSIKILILFRLFSKTKVGLKMVPIVSKGNWKKMKLG